MRLKGLLIGASLTLAAMAAPAVAQRGGDDRWELLAEESVGLGADRDVITLRRDEDYFRNRAYQRLRFIAEGGEVRMKSIELVYLNGYRETVDVGRDVRPGQQIDVDLRGERSYLREIVLNYGTKFGFSIGPGGVRLNQARMKVFAENMRAAPPSPPPQDRGWQQIGRANFDRRDERVRLPVGRREGRFGQIALKLQEGEVVRLREVQVRFANGEMQEIRLDQELREKALTAALDLAGDRRGIEEVIVRLEPRRRPGPAVMELIATERPGEARAPAWEPVGDVRFDRRDGRAEVRAKNTEAIGQIALLLSGEPVRVIEAQIRFGNGDRQTVRIDRELRDGERTQPIDLAGDRRHIVEIEFKLEPRRRPGSVTLTVLGNRRPG